MIFKDCVHMFFIELHGNKKVFLLHKMQFQRGRESSYLGGFLALLCGLCLSEIKNAFWGNFSLCKQVIWFNDERDSFQLSRRAYTGPKSIFSSQAWKKIQYFPGQCGFSSSPGPWIGWIRSFWGHLCNFRCALGLWTLRSRGQLCVVCRQPETIGISLYHIYFQLIAKLVFF